VGQEDLSGAGNQGGERFSGQRRVRIGYNKRFPPARLPPVGAGPLLLGEPGRTPYDLSFSLGSIPVRVHPFFWLVGLLLGLQGGARPAGVLLWMAALFVSILGHELGHALVMRAFGSRPWITLYGLGGLASCHPAEAGWRGHATWRQVAISAAGPGAGFLMAAALIGILYLSGHAPEFRSPRVTWWIVTTPTAFPHEHLGRFLDAMLFLTILWGLVNLLPVYPLDGGQIARELMLAANPRTGIVHSLGLSAAVALAVAIYGLSRQWIFLALLFGYLAYSSYATLQSYRQRGGW
jgi:stage IV sporulation protein FB